MRATGLKAGAVRRWAAVFVLAAAGVLAGGCRSEQTYPSQPIMLICPWSAGGGTDRVSRQVALLLEQELGVPVNVVNATGGAGVTGHTRGALARPDGYTLCMTTVELNMLHWRGLTSISYEDFRPSVLLNRDAAALFVRTDSEWNGAPELIEHIRRNAGRVNASGTAYGGIWHLALAGCLKAAGLGVADANWISINGAGPSMQELIAGGVEVICASLPEAKPQMDAGQVRCLGVMADERLAEFPDVPTLKEQGIDWSIGGWRGVMLPAGTPDAIMEMVTSAMSKVVQGDEFRRFMKEAGFNWSFEGPEEFEKSLAAMDEQFGEVLTSEAFRSIGRRQVGPMFFPGLLVVVVAICLAGIWLRGEMNAETGARRIDGVGWGRFAEVLVWVAAYVLFAEVAGFILTAGVLVAVMMWRMGARPVAAVVIAALLVPSLYQIFAGYLRVPLPRGWLG